MRVHRAFGGARSHATIWGKRSSDTSDPTRAADVPGANEQLGDAAVLVNPAHELEIAQALKSLFHDKAKRESLIRRGKERAHQFTSEDFVKGLFALLDEFQTIRQCWPASLQLPLSA